MPKPDPSTIEALKRLPDAKTHRAKCVALGLPIYWHGTIGRILYEQNVSAMKENEVRQRLGLPPITPPLIPTHPCPSCAARGIIYSHGDKLDCHDKPVVAVALLAPGEVVLPAPMPKRKRRRKAYWRPCFPLMSDQAKRKVWAYAHDLAALEKEHSNDNLLRA